MRKITLTESDLKKIIRKILEQQEPPNQDEILGYVTLRGGRIVKGYPVGEWDQDYENNLKEKISSGNVPFDSWKWVSDDIFFKPESIGKTIQELESGKVDSSVFGKYDLNLQANPKDLSSSKVKDVVFRIGSVIPNSRQGGIWFSPTKEGAENFMISVYGKKLEAAPYHIILKNPYYIENFWNGYVYMIRQDWGGSRDRFQRHLMNSGYDGMIIGNDTWNDTGDEYSVTSKQYVVFDPKNVFSASESQVTPNKTTNPVTERQNMKYLKTYKNFRILKEDEDEGRMDPVSLRATADHIIQVYKSLLDDIEYLKQEMDDTQRSNLHPKDKEYLTGLWIRVLELIHEDTRPPSWEEDDQDY